MNSKVSIRTKLLTYFIAVILISVITNVVSMALHILITNKYQEVEDNIFLQYNLIGATNDLVANYNIYRSTTNDTDLNKYLSSKKNIQDILSELKVTITNKDSEETLVGVEKTIESVLNETDSGVANLRVGDPTDTSAHYSEAYRKFSFVQENVATLILKEVGYSQQLHADTDKINNFSMVFGGLLFVTTLLTLILISVSWSTKLVSPLTQLTTLAKTISLGNVDIEVDKGLLERKDEFGSLSNSFNVMIGNLRKNLNTLTQSNNLISKAKEEVDVKNKELEKMNGFMIDRELKMVELKNKVSELERQTKQKTI